MKKIFTTFLAASLITSAFSQGLKQKTPPPADMEKGITPLKIGSDLPGAEIPMKDVSGREVNMESLRKENGLLVMFSCNTCPYVVKSQKRTKEMATFAEEHNIGMIIINSNEAQRDEQDSYTAMQKYAKGQKYNVPYVLDAGSELANMFGASRTPEVFLFNSEGKLMYHGAMEDNPSSPGDSKEFYLKNAMEKITVGETPEPAFTKSIGCTIKRKA